jgi:hypothetical protein
MKLKRKKKKSNRSTNYCLEAPIGIATPYIETAAIPEKELWASVLDTAIWDLTRLPHNSKDFQDALEWVIFDTHGTFDLCCQVKNYSEAQILAIKNYAHQCCAWMDRLKPITSPTGYSYWWYFN